MSVNSHTKPHLQYNDNTTTVRLMKSAKKVLLLLLGLKKKNRTVETKSS